MNLWALVASVALLLGNGFFVGAEFALIAARRTRMEQLADEGSALAKIAVGSMRELNLMLSGAQLGITMCSLGLGFVAEPALARGFDALLADVADLPPGVTHTIAVVCALTIVVFFHMVIGEMVPKNIAIAQPERSALWLAVPMRVYTKVFRPGIRALNGLANTGLRLLRVEPRDELLIAHSADEIAHMLAESRREGLIPELEHRLLAGALRLQERTVGSVMVPWTRTVGLPKSSSVAGTERASVETGHSRFPVFGEDEEDILGFVHVKDLLRVGQDERSKSLPTDLIRPMPVVRSEDTLRDALVEMRRTHTHFALVVDTSDGRVAGIVTLEDLLEEIVGDIRDEHDVQQVATRGRRRLVGSRSRGNKAPRRARGARGT